MKASCVNQEDKQEKKLKWWQLSIIGVGCITGTGFFLGSAIAIKATGPSVLLVFLLAAYGTYVVFEMLAKMSADDPQKGSFRTYAKKAYGHWAGFSSGWVYWSSEMLIMGSQLTALSLFSRFWFPHVPLWIFASIFAVLGIIIVLSGTKTFERMENIFAIVKIAAIVMFLIIAGLALGGVLDGGVKETNVPRTVGEFFPRGAMGLWAALIYAFYAYGGIEIMGIMSMRLENKEDAPKSGKIMLLVLAALYISSLALAVIMLSWDKFTTKESPFVHALDSYHLAFVPHVFNAALIIAGFSTMAASLYAVTSMLVTLSKDGDAPKLFSKKGRFKKLKVPLPALALTSAGLLTSIILGLVMPDSIYEYITTAAGLMLLYNWFFILMSSHKLLKSKLMDHIKRVSGMILILLAVSGTLLEKASRPGLFVSLAFLAVIGAVVLFLRPRWKREERENPRQA
ncbi:amino acid permease [Bacillus lacus]|uniref:Amino acid permease n=1 Tax=Metabacillus lacus TaxID=1983721 RepID=A0A7X2IXU6_9BACI|nr:amino acid permease [Metabacillus lacus]MRX71604.1 amino acid permease [Metabacillus lacus]